MINIPFCDAYLKDQGVVIYPSPRVSSKPITQPRNEPFVPVIPQYERE